MVYQDQPCNGFDLVVHSKYGSEVLNLVLKLLNGVAHFILSRELCINAGELRIFDIPILLFLL